MASSHSAFDDVETTSSVDSKVYSSGNRIENWREDASRSRAQQFLQRFSKPKQPKVDKNAEKFAGVHPAFRRIVGKKANNAQIKKFKEMSYATYCERQDQDGSSTNADSDSRPPAPFIDEEDIEFARRLKALQEAMDKGLRVRSSILFQKDFSYDFILPSEPSTSMHPFNSDLCDEGPDYGDEIPMFAATNPAAVIQEDSQEPAYECGFFEMARRETIELNKEKALSIESNFRHSELASIKNIHACKTPSTHPYEVQQYTNDCTIDNNPPCIDPIKDKKILDFKVRIPKVVNILQDSEFLDLMSLQVANKRGYLLYAIDSEVVKIPHFIHLLEFPKRFRNKYYIDKALRKGFIVVTNDVKHIKEDTIVLVPTVERFVAEKFISTFKPFPVIKKDYAHLLRVRAFKFKADNYTLKQFLRSNLILMDHKLNGKP